MAHPNAFKDIAENLSYLEDWEDRYRYIIELGQALPPLAEAEKNSATKVQGCVSQVWLVSERAGDLLSYRGRVRRGDRAWARGDPDRALFGAASRRRSPRSTRSRFSTSLGLREHLSTQRSNGLVAMVNRIRSEARAVAG